MSLATLIPILDAFIAIEKAARKKIFAKVISDQYIEVKTFLALDELAKMLSHFMPALWISGSTTITWVNGPAPCVWIAKQKSTPDILSARSTLVSFLEKNDLPMPKRGIPWSSPGCSRKMMDAVGLGINDKAGFADEWLEATGWHSLQCTPTRAEQGYLYDMKSCFQQIFERFPSPLVRMQDNRVAFQTLRGKQEVLYNSMMDHIRENKKMRVSLVGSLVADRVRLWCKGAPMRVGMPRHALRGAGAIAISSAAVLASNQSRASNGVYTHTDCVVTLKEQDMSIWQDYGIKYECKASGPVEVLNIGNRKVGEDETEWFKMRDFIIPEERATARKELPLSMVNYLRSI